MVNKPIDGFFKCLECAGQAHHKLSRKSLKFTHQPAVVLVHVVGLQDRMNLACCTFVIRMLEIANLCGISELSECVFKSFAKVFSFEPVQTVRCAQYWILNFFFADDTPESLD